MNWNNLELPDNYYFKDDTDSVLIYNADCRSILPSIPDKSIDLVLTSPPYDDLRTYGGYLFFLSGLPILLYNALVDGSCCIWIIGDQCEDGSESGSSFRQALKFMECGFNLHDTMIYEKDGFRFPSPNRYHQCFEFMFVFSKGSPKTANLIKDRANTQSGKVKRNRFERKQTGEMKFRPNETVSIAELGIRRNIWCYGTGYMKSAKQDYIFEHPAIFPEALALDHIISWSNPNDLILDPFLGSGTTAYCAKKLNRKCIGIEIEEKYCEIAAKRCSQSVMRLDI